MMEDPGMAGHRAGVPHIARTPRVTTRETQRKRPDNAKTSTEVRQSPTFACVPPVSQYEEVLFSISQQYLVDVFVIDPQIAPSSKRCG